MRYDQWRGRTIKMSQISKHTLISFKHHLMHEMVAERHHRNINPLLQKPAILLIRTCIRSIRYLFIKIPYVKTKNLRRWFCSPLALIHSFDGFVELAKISSPSRRCFIVSRNASRQWQPLSYTRLLNRRLSMRLNFTTLPP